MICSSKVGYGKSWFCISNSIKEKFQSYLKRTNMTFHPYQLDGVKWCVCGETDVSPLYGVKGGFLADEMGLGKTIMMIGTFVCNYLPRTLIVVPVILIEQWYNQIYKTTGHKAVIFHGTGKKKCSKEILEKATIVITTYAHISLNKNKNKKNTDLVDLDLDSDSSSLLHEIQWSRVVFDEAHHLRNKGTRKHDGSHLLKTDIVWFISGTPIQNRKKDFYHLCSILKIPSSVYTDAVDGIPSIVERFVLRRTKKEVGIDCGELNSLKCEVSWKAENEMLMSKNIHSYLSINKDLREALVLATLKKDVVEGGGGHDSPFDSKGQLELYIRAKQCCILPNLIGKRLLGKDLWKSNYTSKIDAVVDCVLSKQMNGNGKLIFCNYRFEMDTLANKLNDGGIEKERILIFDGRLTNSARKKCLKDLSIYSVIIIQIQTGCEGLNLQDYFNEVYFVSPNWNPCVEDQAIARCHRIGQQKKVFVYKFEMINDVISDDNMSLISDVLPLDVKRLIVDYIPICNMKWINMDEYIVSVQGIKREIIREFIY